MRDPGRVRARRHAAAAARGRFARHGAHEALGVAFVVLYVFGVLLSLSLTFAPRIRCCCHSFVTLIHDYGICVFLLTHMALLSMSSYTLYMFLLPFLKAHDFNAYCALHKLSDNLSHTGCERLQGERRSCLRG